MTSSRSSTGSGLVSGCAGTVSAAQVGVGEPARAAGARSRRRSACGTSAPSSFARTSDGRLPDEGERRLPEVDVGDPHQRQPLQRPVGADEVLDEVVGGRHQELGRGRVLRQVPALAQDRDPVAHLDRLVDVVGDEEDRLAHLGLEAQELVLQPLAVDRVDGAERLVHQHHAGVGGQRARDADPLLLAAGELRRVAVAKRRVESDQVQQLLDSRLDRARCPSRAAAGRWRCSRPTVRCGKRPICWIT